MSRSVEGMDYMVDRYAFLGVPQDAHSDGTLLTHAVRAGTGA